MAIRLTCRASSELLSQAQERRLGAGERLAVRLHLLVCRRCRSFERQLAFIRRACRRLPQTLDDEP